MSRLDFVDLATARATPGLRLVILAGAPSPWSQAAKAMVELKRIPAVGVRLRPKDADIRAWTGSQNAPVALFDDEIPRTGWAEILALLERLEPGVPLVPAAIDARLRMFGLAHELLGEGGMLWASRLVMIEASLTSEGREAFILPVARHLAPRYGYTPGSGGPAAARMVEVLTLLAAQLEASGGTYYMGDRITALDVCSAAAMNTVVPLSETDCPMHPSVRSGFEWMAARMKGVVSPALIAHRDRMYAEHLALPLQL